MKFKFSAPLLVVVPDVVGKTTLAAKNALQAAGFTTTVILLASPGKPAGRVWDQSPDAGASVGPGTNVTIRVQPGVGPALAVVPGVVGKLTAVASAEISAAGFVPDVVEAFAIGKPLGRVFAQDPVGGSSRVLGSVVTLKIPKVIVGPALVTVPNLIGLTPLAAKAALQAKGLGSDGQMQIHFGKPHNKVYSQSKSPGTLVGPGTTISWRWNP